MAGRALVREGEVPGVIPVGLAGACKVPLRLPQGFFAPSKLAERERVALVAALGDDQMGAAAVEAALLPLLRRRARPEARVALILLLVSAVWTAVGPLGMVALSEGGGVEFAFLVPTLFSSIVFLALWLLVGVIGDHLRRSSMLPLRAEVLENLNSLRFDRRPRGVSFRVAGSSSASSAFANLVMEVAAPIAPSSAPGEGEGEVVAASLPSWASLGPRETLSSRRLFLDDTRAPLGFRVFGTLFYTSGHPRSAPLIARVDMGVTDGDMAAFVDGAEAIVKNHKSPGYVGSLFLAMPLLFLGFTPLIPGINGAVSLTLSLLSIVGVFAAAIAGALHSRRNYTKYMVELRQLADECTARHSRVRFHVDRPRMERAGALFAMIGSPPPLSLSAKVDADDEDDASTIRVVTP